MALLKKDSAFIIFLVLLYFLQGVLTGLFQSLQLILSELNATYYDQGLFYSTSFPMTLKLLWAPFVDRIYFVRIGHRKTWLVPVQYMIGFILIGSATYIHKALGTGNKNIHNG